MAKHPLVVVQGEKYFGGKLSTDQYMNIFFNSMEGFADESIFFAQAMLSDKGYIFKDGAIIGKTKG